MTSTITSFQQKVYDATSKIPKGKISTYKDIATYLNCGSCQAIGQALKNNPFAPTVPCHRVVKSDFTIGGFFGSNSGPNVLKKQQLLESEGISFDSNKPHHIE
jgi:methylated-DNA-[protein]-cysteine S-methyltransferase